MNAAPATATAQNTGLTSQMLLDNMENIKVENAKAHVIGFGKYNGKTLEQIVITDRRYAMWLSENTNFNSISTFLKLVLTAIPVEQSVAVVPMAPAKAAAEPCNVVVPFGKYATKTIGQICGLDLSYLNWLATKSNDTILQQAAAVVYKAKKSTERAERKATVARELVLEQMKAKAEYESLLASARELFINRIAATPVIATFGTFSENGGRLNKVVRIVNFSVGSIDKFGKMVPCVNATVETIENEKVVSTKKETFTFGESDIKRFNRTFFLFGSVSDLKGDFYMELNQNGMSGVVYDMNQKQVATVVLRYEREYHQWCHSEHPGFDLLKQATFTLNDGTTVDKFPGSLEGYKQGGLWS